MITAMRAGAGVSGSMPTNRVAAYLRSGVFGALLLGAQCAHAADILRGKELYGQQCAMCHGVSGMAVLPGAPDFVRGERLMQPDILLLGQIRTGKGVMPGFQGILPDRDILSVIAFLRTLR